jgi:hypothetical protein
VGNRRTHALPPVVLFTFSAVAVSAVGSSLSGCAPRDPPIGDSASAIQGGSVDPRDTSVVAVAMTDGNGYIVRTCSGTLVAPNLVLTAQHCVAEATPYVDCRTSVFGPSTDPQRLRVTFSASMWSRDADWLHVTEVVRPAGNSVCGNDVALLMLATSVDPESALPIPPRLDELPAREEEYAAVGYGTTSGDSDDAGLRRRRNALRVVCVGDACSSRQVEAAEWRGDHGICNGDSGGPAIDEEGFVIGVTSRGPKGCDNPIYGGLSGHAGWMRDAAKRAALNGAYGNLDWAAEPGTRAATQVSSSDATARGCGVDGQGGHEGAGWLIGVLTWLASRRRRS